MALTLVPPRGEDILADQITYFLSQNARPTDFNAGSAVRSLLEAVSLVLERQGVGYWAALGQAIDEAVFAAWGFERRPAIAATGRVRCFVTPGLTPANLGVPIAVGQRLRVPGAQQQIYVVTPPEGGGSTWTVTPAEGYVDVNVVCITPGTAGNIVQGLVTEALPPIANIVQITNPQAITGGQDVATDAERRADFASYIQSLPRGTVAALRFGATTAALFDTNGIVVERVRKARVIEGGTTDASLVLNPGGGGIATGTVGVYIHNGTGPATGDLVTQCQKILEGYTDTLGIIWDGWRPAGIPTTVYAATEQLVNVALTVAVQEGYLPQQVAPLVARAVRQVLDGLNIGDVLYLNALVSAIADVPGVDHFTISGPGGNTTPTTPDRVLRLGTLSGTASLAGVGAEIA